MLERSLDMDMGTCEFFGLNFGAANCGKNASGSKPVGPVDKVMFTPMHVLLMVCS